MKQRFDTVLYGGVRNIDGQIWIDSATVGYSIGEVKELIAEDSKEWPQAYQKYPFLGIGRLEGIVTWEAWDEKATDIGQGSEGSRSPGDDGGRCAATQSNPVSSSSGEAR